MRGRISQSDSVRNASGERLSLTSAYFTSQPTAEVTGNITGGLAVLGKLLSTF